MSEAKAFAAGYAAAIKMLTPVDPPRGGWCGSGAQTVECSQLAIEILKQGVGLVPDLFESWQLTQDPDFLESLAQMQRGEGREIDFDKLLDVARLREQESLAHADCERTQDLLIRYIRASAHSELGPVLSLNDIAVALRAAQGPQAEVCHQAADLIAPVEFTENTET